MPLSNAPKPLASKGATAANQPVVLTRREDFLAARKSGYKGIGFAIIVQMNPQPTYPHDPELPQLRYGLTASKRTGNAVCRNRSRRRMRNLAKQHLATQGAVGCDYVLIARYNTARVPYVELVRDFKCALKQAHLPIEMQHHDDRDHTKKKKRKARQ